MSTPEEGTPLEEETPMDGQEEENGQDWEKRYKDLQAQYTKTAQELADEKKASERTSDAPTDDEKATLEWLSKHGFVTKDELDSLQKKAQLEDEFRDLLEVNPSLKQYEKAIRALQASDGRSYEEVAIENGFMSSEDKIERAKSTRKRMVSGEAPRQKSVMDMTTAEYEEYKKKAGLTGNLGSTLRGAK